MLGARPDPVPRMTPIALPSVAAPPSPRRLRFDATWPGALALARHLLLVLLASPLFLPFTTVGVGLPLAHLLSFARTHDVAAGESLYATLPVPVVDRANPQAEVAVAFIYTELPARLQRWPGLTPRVTATGSTRDPASGRVWWRVLEDGPDGQLVELRHEMTLANHTVRYRATDAGVTLLTSRMFSAREWQPALLVGFAFALMLMRFFRPRLAAARARLS
jgi:hypothetical protein